MRALVAVSILSLVFVGWTSFATASTATEQPHGFPAPSPDVLLWSARSCYAEALWSQSDCSAILHVIRKRATRRDWTFLRMLQAYSVRNWKTTPHGREVMQLQLGSNPDRSNSWNRKWRWLVSHTAAVLSSQAQDPCPAADHWAAPYYRVPFKVQAVRCREQTANVFYAAI